jgi:hypothetical protein
MIAEAVIPSATNEDPSAMVLIPIEVEAATRLSCSRPSRRFLDSCLQKEIVMTAEASRSTSTLTLDEPAPTTSFDVAVVFVPPPPEGGDPIFRFFGLTVPNNAMVQTQQADFTLTLSINGPGTVSFAGDAITWLPPGDQTKPIPQPDYIVGLTVTDSVVKFTDLNLADPTAMILVSFVVNVQYTPAVANGLAGDDGAVPYSSRGIAYFADTFTSHDPTIINVDPTGSGNLTPAGA